MTEADDCLPNDTRFATVVPAGRIETPPPLVPVPAPATGKIPPPPPGSARRTSQQYSPISLYLPAGEHRRHEPDVPH
jgi:hypothetical protein